MATTFNSVDPSTGEIGPAYEEATADDVQAAVAAAADAHRSGALADPAKRAALLRGAAARLRAAGDEIVTTAMTETGLPEGRLRGELERTAGQLEAFAAVVDAGDYVEAIVDTPDPDAKPIPRPDVRRMLVPIGPVAVFGASNFPLAFSTAGGDTASALAAGVPVIVKGHPSHPGTSERVAREVSAAAADAGLPAGTFAHLPAASLEVAQALVDAPAVKAVGFTGSYAGGRSIADRAAARPEPIPVYAEMGSVNPIVVTAAALEARAGGDRGGPGGLGGELRRPALHQAGRRVRPLRRGGQRVRRRRRQAAGGHRADRAAQRAPARRAARRRRPARAARRAARRLTRGERARVPAPAERLRGRRRRSRHDPGAARGALRAGRAVRPLRDARRPAGGAGPRRGPAHRDGARAGGRGRRDDRRGAARAGRPRDLRRLPDRRRGHLRHAPRRPVPVHERARAHLGRHDRDHALAAARRLPERAAGAAPGRAEAGQPARDLAARGRRADARSR